MGRINRDLLRKMEEGLKQGVLSDLLKELKQDDTITLEFRADYLSIYYRGGCISKLVYNEINNYYIDYFDSNYGIENKLGAVANIIKTSNDCKFLINNISERKKIMNTYFSSTPKMERQYQQIIEWENNRDIHSNFTITDIEYQKSNNCRFDMIAVNRPRQKDYRNLKLSVIELKYGANSIANSSGIYEHFKDVNELTPEFIRDLINETEFVINCKCRLGLLSLLDSIKNGMDIRKDSIDLIYYIGDISLEQREKLIEGLNKINTEVKSEKLNKEIDLDVKVFCPYLTGNVMFESDILSIDEFLKLNELKENIIKLRQS